VLQDVNQALWAQECVHFFSLFTSPRASNWGKSNKTQFSSLLISTRLTISFVYSKATENARFRNQKKIMALSNIIHRPRSPISHCNYKTLKLVKAIIWVPAKTFKIYDFENKKEEDAFVDKGVVTSTNKLTVNNAELLGSNEDFGTLNVFSCRGI
jgi:hypothetical protein